MTELRFKPGDKVRRTSGMYSPFFRPGDVAVVVEHRYSTGDVLVEMDGKRRLTRVENWRSAEPEKAFIQQVADLVGLITYKPGWYIETRKDGDRVYVQLSVSAFAEASMDSVKRDGTRTPWKSAKRYLSPHMCKQELVGVIFDLIKSAELHEVHEWFRYKNASIYNPHLDPDALAVLARKKESFVVRENAMTMVEEAA